MSDLVIGGLTHRLELKPCLNSHDNNINGLKYTNNIQILNYKWIETYSSNERISLESDQSNSTVHLESIGDKCIIKCNEINNNEFIPFNLLYPKVYNEVSQLIRSDGAIGCLIISEVDFLVEEFCIFLTKISKYNYKIDLSRFVYSEVTSSFISTGDNLSDNLSKLSLKAEIPTETAEESIEKITSQISQQLKYYIPHLPECNLVNLLAVLKSKHIYTFEDNLLLVTIHAICISSISKSSIDEEELNKIFSKLGLVECGVNEDLFDRAITLTLCNVCTFSVAAEMEDQYFHTHQMMDLLTLYMKAWKELDLPVKFIVPYERVENNPISLLSSSDLVGRFMRLPFPMMRWQRQILFQWKLGMNSKISKLVDFSNGLALAEVLNLPIMKGWDPVNQEDDVESLNPDYYFDYMDSIMNTNHVMESHIVTGIAGMGKTNYAINLARKLQVPFVRFSVTEYLRPEIGLSEKEICKFFKGIYKYSSGDISCVLLLEYLDSVNMYGIKSVVARELNNLLSNNYWNFVKILVVVTLMGNIDNLKDYPMVKKFKVIKLEELNLDKTTNVLAHMLSKTFDNSEEIINSWKAKQDKNSVFTISQIKDIVESAKMKSFARLLENGNDEDRLTLALDDLITDCTLK